VIYFKDPDLKIHEESWGAVVRTETDVEILDGDLWAFFKGFREVVLPDGVEPQGHLEYMVQIGVVLSISDEEAANIRERKKSARDSFVNVR